jgi:hypothetical protein
MILHRLLSIALSLTLTQVLFSCASSMPVETQKYATLRTSLDFEYPFDVTWKGIETSLAGFKVTERDPETLSLTELRNATKRTLETDWINSKSKTRYVEYKVNDLPRKKYLQVRYKYSIEATAKPGATKVTISTDEEIELLKQDGTSNGWESAKVSDTARANALLEQIKLSLLAQSATSNN